MTLTPNRSSLTGRTGATGGPGGEVWASKAAGLLSDAASAAEDPKRVLRSMEKFTWELHSKGLIGRELCTTPEGAPVTAMQRSGGPGICPLGGETTR